jgi:hypothetical protein
VVVPGLLACADVLTACALVCLAGSVSVIFAPCWLWLGLPLLALGVVCGATALGLTGALGGGALVSVLPLSWHGEVVLDGGVGSRALPYK